MVLPILGGGYASRNLWEIMKRLGEMVGDVCRKGELPLINMLVDI